MSAFDDYDAFSEFSDSDFERSEDDDELSKPKEEPKEEPSAKKVVSPSDRIAQKQAALVKSFREIETMLQRYHVYISELMNVKPDPECKYILQKYVDVAFSNSTYLSDKCEELKYRYESFKGSNNKLSLLEFEQKLNELGKDVRIQVDSMEMHITKRKCVNEFGEKVELYPKTKLVDSEGNEFQSEVQIPKDALDKIWHLLNETFPWY